MRCRNQERTRAKRARMQAALKRARDAAMAAEAELESAVGGVVGSWTRWLGAAVWAHNWAQGGAAHAAST